MPRSKQESAVEEVSLPRENTTIPAPPQPSIRAGRYARRPPLPAAKQRERVAAEGGRNYRSCRWNRPCHRAALCRGRGTDCGVGRFC